VSQHAYPVLILGESGTGKELVARSVHFSGVRRNKLFIPGDCSSLVPTLIEAELFGYVKGAFTEALHAKQGFMEIADGGTLFLDEIGDLPFDVQAKLLRVLQEKEVRPVGRFRRASSPRRTAIWTPRCAREPSARPFFPVERGANRGGPCGASARDHPAVERCMG